MLLIPLWKRYSISGWDGKTWFQPVRWNVREATQTWLLEKSKEQSGGEEFWSRHQIESNARSFMLVMSRCACSTSFVGTLLLKCSSFACRYRRKQNHLRGIWHSDICSCITYWIESDDHIFSGLINRIAVRESGVGWVGMICPSAVGVIGEVWHVLFFVFRCWTCSEKE